MNIYQYKFHEEIIIDAFCGGGGASTGIETALGRIVDIAINHDPDAISMHERNHPFTEHYQEDIFAIDIEKAVRGRDVALLWASPACTHFSRARGGEPVTKQMRSQAWVVLKWASKIKPRVIILENVKEFLTWGPVKDGKPIKEKSGVLFNWFVYHLRNLGYAVEWKVLSADDYGAATKRERLCLVARCDGRPIVFPKPTHGDGLIPKVPASKFIDFSVRGKSIFERPKGLAVNTLKRIAKGLDKFTIKNKKPFIIPIGYGDSKGHSPRVNKNNMDVSLGTAVASSIKHNLILPHVHKYFNGKEQKGSDINKPLSTVTQVDHNALASANLMQIGQSPFISQIQFENDPQDIKKPLSTICSVNKHNITASCFSPYMMTNTTGHSCTDVQDSVPVFTTGNQQYLMSPHLSHYHTETKEGAVRASDLRDSCNVIDTSNRYAVASANLLTYYKNGKAIKVTAPLPTQTTKDRMGLVENHLCVLRNNCDCKSLDESLPTVLTSAGHFAEVKTYLVEYDDGVDLKYWPQIRALLNDYAGYNIANNQVLILEMAGVRYFISDIEMRMLLPKELYGCQGFPLDYVFEYGKDGKPLTKTAQVRMVGNSVCPPFARAMVAANLPELIVRSDIQTMGELTHVVCNA